MEASRDTRSSRRLRTRMRRTMSALLTALLAAVGVIAVPPAVAAAADLVVTAAGSFNSEIGCPGDWQPDCAGSATQQKSQRRDLLGHPQHPGRRLRIQGRDRWHLGRELRAGRCPRRWQRRVVARCRQRGDLLLQPRHASFQHLGRWPGHHCRRGVFRASWVAPVIGPRTAWCPG